MVFILCDISYVWFGPPLFTLILGAVMSLILLLLFRYCYISIVYFNLVTRHGMERPDCSHFWRLFCVISRMFG